VMTPNGPMVVYGCVISWANEPNLDDGSPATLWQAHAEVIDRVDRDLHTIRNGYPGVPVVVAGDFNQDRDGSGWYGTHAVRRQLGEVLDRHELTCVTGFDVVAAGLLHDRHLVDHICVPHRLAEVAEVSCWEPTDTDGVRLSDHPTVAVDV
jgi:endonuclease/exonuclease/phosphatase family metal-dependent hydrolase